MRMDNDDASLCGLLCLESDIGLEEDEVLDETASSLYLYKCSPLTDEEHFKMLVDTETSFGFKRKDSLVLSDWVKCARLEAIAWILKTRAVFGFHFQTAYLSLTYFDRFLSKRSIDSGKSWAIPLLSLACLSLAAKMEELKVPALSEFHVDEYNFESKVIQRMELLVLNTLEWRMCSVTPFAFLHYFITKLSEYSSPPNHVVSRTVQLILAIMREIDLMEHRPSVIAAAASLVALDQKLTRKALECKMDSVSFCGFLEIEDVCSCYNLMQNLEVEKFGTPELLKSPDLSPPRLRQIKLLDNSSSSSAIGTKRRRLTFDK